MEFLGLRSKMYSILDESNNEKSTNKGHNAFIEFQEFRDTLSQKKILIWAPTELMKYLYHVLIIKDVFSEMESKHLPEMESKHLHMDIKIYKND